MLITKLQFGFERTNMMEAKNGYQFLFRRRSIDCYVNENGYHEMLKEVKETDIVVTTLLIEWQ